MEDATVNTAGTRRPSRREFIKRSAVAGGAAVWAPPVVQSITSPAFGQTIYPPPGRDISFVALLLICDSTYHRIKFAAGGGIECGRNFAVGGCRDQLRRGDAAVSDDCPRGVSAVFQPDGAVRVTLGTCSDPGLIDYVVKCGVRSDPDDSGCEDLLGSTSEGNQPKPPFGSVVTFVPCSAGDDPSNGGADD